MKNATPSPVVSSRGLALLSVFFWGLYVLGTFFPDTWWTTHFLAFLGPGWRYGFLAVATGLMAYPFVFPKGMGISPRLLKTSERYGHLFILAIVMLTGILIYHFPIAHDHYGDAYKLLHRLDDPVSDIPEGANEAFFRFTLSPWDGHTSVLALVTYIGYYGAMTYGKAFLWLDLVCGCLFVWVWLSFLRKYLNPGLGRLIMGLAGIAAPFMLIYFGHIESYAPVFLLFLSWQVVALMYLKTQHKGWLWALIPLLLLCMKAHPVALLFLPALGLLFIHQFAQPESWFARQLSWKGISRWILLPVGIVGMVLYFFVFQDYNDPRDLSQTAMEFDRLFLPLVVPEPPLDHYHMLSVNHLFDYFCEMLLWSPIVWFVLLYTGIYGRKQITWNALPVLVSGLSLILLGSLFFVINPLLSMQLDWDLLAIPAPIFLVFGAAVVKEVENGEKSWISFNKILPACLALALLNVPMYMVHAQTDPLSQRLESLGIRMYHTYYEWSSKVCKFALNLPEYPSSDAYISRLNDLLQRLQPEAIPQKDFEYARLLTEGGRFYLRVQKDYPKAMSFLNRAERYYPPENLGLLYKMETHFVLKQFPEAYEYALRLMDISYPSEDKSNAIAIQCALEAGLYEEALELSVRYLKKWPNNSLINEVYRRLMADENREEIRLLFAQPD